jgi:hypothetical protein
MSFQNGAYTYKNQSIDIINSISLTRIFPNIDGIIQKKNIKLPSLHISNKHASLIPFANTVPALIHTSLLFQSDDTIPIVNQSTYNIVSHDNITDTMTSCMQLLTEEVLCMNKIEFSKYKKTSVYMNLPFYYKSKLNSDRRKYQNKIHKREVRKQNR